MVSPSTSPSRVTPILSPQARPPLDQGKTKDTDKQYAMLLNKVMDLERDRDRLMQGQNIVEVLNNGQKEMQKLDLYSEEGET